MSAITQNLSAILPTWSLCFSSFLASTGDLIEVTIYDWTIAHSRENMVEKNAKGKAMYIPGQVWHITHRCPSRNFCLGSGEIDNVGNIGCLKLKNGMVYRS
jgi:hypothetical protein